MFIVCTDPRRVVPTEIEERAMDGMSFYKRPADPNVARGVSQSIYKYLLPEKLQEVKDEEIFQNFRPPTAGLDDPLLIALAKNAGYVLHPRLALVLCVNLHWMNARPIATSGSQPIFRKSGSAGRFPSPRDSTPASVALLWLLLSCISVLTYLHHSFSLLWGKKACSDSINS